MEELIKLFEAFEPREELKEELKRICMESRYQDMLKEKISYEELMAIESSINTILSNHERLFFIAGFKTAVRIVLECSSQ